jgi:hypothetical protein
MVNQKEDHMSQAVEEKVNILNTVGLAKLYNTSPQTIVRMRKKGVGPPWFDLQNGTGERVITRYREDLALKWTEQNPDTIKE